jgi:very-long-chain ceramide synthase
MAHRVSVILFRSVLTITRFSWSYLINLTPIGNAVYLSMDVSDIFLAVCNITVYPCDTSHSLLLQFAKLCNYLKMEKVKAWVFGWFVCVWT